MPRAQRSQPCAPKQAGVDRDDDGAHRHQHGAYDREQHNPPRHRYTSGKRSADSVGDALENPGRSTMRSHYRWPHGWTWESAPAHQWPAPLGPAPCRCPPKVVDELLELRLHVVRVMPGIVIAKLSRHRRSPSQSASCNRIAYDPKPPDASFFRFEPAPLLRDLVHIIVIVVPDYHHSNHGVTCLLATSLRGTSAQCVDI